MPTCRRLFATPDGSENQADEESVAGLGIEGTDRIATNKPTTNDRVASKPTTKPSNRKEPPSKKKRRTWKPMEKCNMSKLEYADHAAIPRKNFVDLVKEITLDFGANQGRHERTTKDMINALQSASEAHLIKNMHWAGEASKNAKRKRTGPRDYKLVRDITEREQHQYYHGTKL